MDLKISLVEVTVRVENNRSPIVDKHHILNGLYLNRGIG
jgi:hypothetical protein